ncbi:hypothetical protein DH2020_037804 [Rehmannia glutinosa]|uniref:Uncharacterized protein n=1 Tax=Rehmannia glutinosa TaxID=99300 RepID=A0ABR0V0N0_REHGL
MSSTDESHSAKTPAPQRGGRKWYSGARLGALLRAISSAAARAYGPGRILGLFGRNFYGFKPINRTREGQTRAIQLRSGTAYDGPKLPSHATQEDPSDSEVPIEEESKQDEDKQSNEQTEATKPKSAPNLDSACVRSEIARHITVDPLERCLTQSLVQGMDYDFDDIDLLDYVLSLDATQVDTSKGLEESLGDTVIEEIPKRVLPFGAVELRSKDGSTFQVNGQRLKHYFGDEARKILNLLLGDADSTRKGKGKAKASTSADYDTERFVSQAAQETFFGKLMTRRINAEWGFQPQLAKFDTAMIIAASIHQVVHHKSTGGMCMPALICGLSLAEGIVLEKNEPLERPKAPIDSATIASYEDTTDGVPDPRGEGYIIYPDRAPSASPTAAAYDVPSHSHHVEGTSSSAAERSHPSTLQDDPTHEYYLQLWELRRAHRRLAVAFQEEQRPARSATRV